MHEMRTWEGQAEEWRWLLVAVAVFCSLYIAFENCSEVLPSMADSGLGACSEVSKVNRVGGIRGG